MKDQGKWDEISPSTGLLDLKLKEVWRYRDLLLLLVRRDFVAVYKQTILGPIWFVIQPVLTTVIFTFVFGNIAGMATDGIPKPLFYITGITLWNYFSECVTNTSDTFTKNASIFGKVYFPRLIVPISVIVSNLFKLGIQLVLLVAVWTYFVATGANVHVNSTIVLLPVLILIMAVMGLGIGMIVSSLTTKYRDLTFLITFGIQLLMYGSPVIFPLSGLAGPEMKTLKLAILANPMTSIIEAFRYSLLGAGEFNWMYLAYSAGFAGVVFFLGVIVFNQVEKSFMDTV